VNERRLEEAAMGSSVTVEAVFEDGKLRPLQPLDLSPGQRVRVEVHLPPAANPWPPEVEVIYEELEAEDRAVAAKMVPLIKETWPQSDGLLDPG
jgi:predicted DNA-binding antitoxin AbrB/MazE fold protein